MNSKFDFYEVARVSSNKKHLKSYNSKLVIITGKSQSEEEPSVWAYSVRFNGLEESHFIFEEDLEKTGKSVSADYIMSNEIVKLDTDGNIIEID